MAIIKCKMCGGDLVIEQGNSVAECEYCGTMQTLPKVNDEVIQNLFNRANNLRLKCEFDKAEQIYEKILQQNDNEPEAHWGIILCKYGIEYVEDPKTFKRVPTCHRTSYDAITADADYIAAIENADVVSRGIYEAEAKAIDEIQKNILNIVKNEKPFDVFICYKESDENGKRTVDSAIANDIYHQLTQEGLKVFYSAITLEDKLGQEYEPYIFAALNSAKAMLVIGTKPEYFSAVWVKNEWSRYLKLMKTDRSKLLIPCYKDMDAYDLPEEFAHLQAQDMSKIGFINDVVRGIKKVVVKDEPKTETVVKQTIVTEGNTNTTPLLKRAFMFLEDGDWKSADEYCEKVLDIDPECAEAYLGKLLCVLKLKSEEALADLNESFKEAKYLDKVMRFANGDLKKRINGYLKTVTDRIDEETRIAEEKRRIAEEKRREKIKYLSEKQTRSRKASTLIAASNHTLGLRSDGTVIATGNNANGQCYVKNWRDIVSVFTGAFYSIGLKSDGTVVAIGSNKNDECKVSTWKNIIDISGEYHSLGLKSDGTVIATGYNNDGRCNVADWVDIVDISAGGFHSLGLKQDGTVVAIWQKGDVQHDVSNWKNIVYISAGHEHSLGLNEDGTAVATGSNKYDQCNVSDWTNIIAVSAGGYHSLGLNEDGTVVATGYNAFGQCNVSSWTDIIAIATGFSYSVGLKSDGTVVATGYNEDGRCNVSNWKLFEDYDNLDLERKQKLEQRSAEETQSELFKERYQLLSTRRSQNLCQHCGGTFKGLFTKKCVNCGKVKDY